jgi:hypothetical protein
MIQIIDSLNHIKQKGHQRYKHATQSGCNTSKQIILID